jgi:Holliday junction resolvasome RuvABC ATP-dependent DNA helicase subunit
MMSEIDTIIACLQESDGDRRLAILNPNDSRCKIVGNRHVLTRLSRYARSDTPVNLAFVGPPGVGKTTIARVFAEAKDIPLVEIQPQMVNSINDILVLIAENYEARGKELMTEFEKAGEGNEKEFIPDPCAIFIDEVHALRKDVVQGLLKATEPNDMRMITEKGFSVDCKNINWLIATTELGLVFPPFKSRFSLVRLKLYTKEELAKIVNMKFPTWHPTVCSWIAYYSSLTREALALAKDVELEKNIQQERGIRPNMVELISKIAEENGIDSLGMRKDRVLVLKMLGEGPASRARLCATLGCQEEELVRDIMPPLLALTEDSDPLVTTCSRGYLITDTGRVELDERSIPHNGHEEENEKCLK